MPTAAEPLISRKELARRLGKAVRTIDAWRDKRLIPSEKVGGSVMFDWPAVRRAMQERGGIEAIKPPPKVRLNVSDRQLTELLIGRRL